MLVVADLAVLPVGRLPVNFVIHFQFLLLFSSVLVVVEAAARRGVRNS